MHLLMISVVYFQQEIPMNFVDPKEYDIPGLVRKNRYKTILPSKHQIYISATIVAEIYNRILKFAFLLELWDSAKSVSNTLEQLLVVLAIHMLISCMVSP